MMTKPHRYGMFTAFFGLVLVLLTFFACQNPLGGPGHASASGGSRALSPGFRIVGYSAGWRGNAEEIRYDQLTHIIYAFAIPDTAGNIISLENTAKLQGIVSRAHARGVKVSLAVGGWSYNGAELDGTFEVLAANPAARANLVSKLLGLVDQYQLDGIDMDWEYPDAGTQSANNFTALMTELSAALKPKGKLLSAAVTASGWAGNAVSAEVMAKVDFLNIMAYDGDAGSGHSPMSYATGALDFWIGQRGLPAAKANLGVPFYARPSWRPYDELVPLAPALVPTVDNYQGDWYNGIPTITQKTTLAMNRAGGVMIWELSHDTNDRTSLLNAIWETAAGTVVEPDTQAPTVPQGLVMSSSSSTSLVLGWQASSDNRGVHSYELAVEGGSTLAVNGTAHTLASLAADTEYRVKVRARDAAGNWSAWSTTLVARTRKSGQADGPATGIPGTPALSQSSWNGDASYSITMDMWWGNNGTLVELFENDILVATRDLTDASPAAQKVVFAFSNKPKGTYRYLARLGNRFGSTSSGQLSYTVSQGSTGGTDTQAPAAPGQLSVQATSTSIRLTWNAATDNLGVSLYRLFRSGAEVGTTTDLSWTFEGLSPSTGYEVGVKAQDAAGNLSPLSSLQAVTAKDSGTGGGTWTLGATYTVGDVVTWAGRTYRCTLAHTAHSETWNPPAAPTLWTPL